MTQNKIKRTVGLTLVTAHLIFIVLITVFTLAGKYDAIESKIAFAIVTPVFLSFGVSIIKFFVETQTQVEDTSPAVNSTFITLSFLLPFIFFIFLSLVLINQALYKKQDEEIFTTLLGLSESVFGLYIGAVIKGLFERKE